MPATKYAKQLIAREQLEVGKAFLASAGLLRKHADHEATHYVSLHLVGQGLECILKGVLLQKDFDYFYPKLRGKFGHDLEALVKFVLESFSIKGLDEASMAELRALNHHYKKNNHLRYSGLHSIFIDPRSISMPNLEKRLLILLRMLRLSDQKGRKQN